MNIKDEFTAWFDARRDDIAHRLMDYIAVNTTTPNEAAAESFLHDYLATIEAQIEFADFPSDLAKHWSFSPHEASLVRHGRGSWRAKLGQGEGPVRTLFNAHVDVVPPSPDFPGAFQPVRTDDTITGRGACDTKNNLIMLIEAIRFLRETGIPLYRTALVDLPIEEEVGGNGTLALALALAAEEADEAICLEPTSLEVMRGHRGCLTFRVEVQGRSVHMGSKSTGMDAIAGAIDVVSALRSLEKRLLTAAASEEGFENVANPLQLNIGIISGGEWSGSVAERCVVDGDLGFLPSMSLADVEREIEESCRSIPSTWMAERLKVRFDVGLRNDACLIAADEPVVTDLASAIRRHDMGQGQVGAWWVSCDARLYQKVRGLPTVIFGSGSLADAHSSHERVSLSEIAKGAAVLADFLSTPSATL